jgi:hypothetical protein
MFTSFNQVFFLFLTQKIEEFDYIPPSLVSLFVSNDKYGTRDTSYIYRLLTDYYHPLDYILKEEEEEKESKVQEGGDFEDEEDEDIDEEDVLLVE